jgi:hypothetical protein
MTHDHYPPHPARRLAPGALPRPVVGAGGSNGGVGGGGVRGKGDAMNQNSTQPGTAINLGPTRGITCPAEPSPGRRGFRAGGGTAEPQPARNVRPRPVCTTPLRRAACWESRRVVSPPPLRVDRAGRDGKTPMEDMPESDVVRSDCRGISTPALRPRDERREVASDEHFSPAPRSHRTCNSPAAN